MKRISISCGDWHLGWGLGGKNKLGKLSTEDFNTFTWDGYSQGRHGNKSNLGAQFAFTLDGERIVEVSRKGSIPWLSEIYKAVEGLKALAIEVEQKAEKAKARKQRAEQKLKALQSVKQTNLF